MRKSLNDKLWTKLNVNLYLFFKENYKKFKKGDVIQVPSVYGIIEKGVIQMFVIVDKEVISLDKFEVLNKDNLKIFKKNL